MQCPGYGTLLCRNLFTAIICNGILDASSSVEREPILRNELVRPRRIIEYAIVSQNSSFLPFPLELIKRWFVRIESSRDGNVTLVNASTPCFILHIVYDFPRLQYHAEKLTFLRLNNTGLNQMINSDSKKKKNTISTPCLSKPYIYIHISLIHVVTFA